MDMIASGIEACPWGLKGYGFAPYAAGSPGSEVLALARYWADHAREIREAEERHPDRCHRVRYEDLVDDPETVADGIFRFLGVPSSPGISARCFTPERERQGPGDFKIWQTSRITADSVGRGWSIPADQIERPVRDRINQLADELGYLRVDHMWSVADTPPDFRAGHGGASAAAAATPRDSTRQMSRAFLLLGERLQAGLFRVSDRFVRAWGSCAGERFLVVATSPGGDDRVARWRVDLSARTVTLADASADNAAANGAVSWQLTGSAATWEQVLADPANLNVALRRRELRYADTGTGHRDEDRHAVRPARHHRCQCLVPRPPGQHAVADEFDRAGGVGDSDANLTSIAVEHRHASRSGRVTGKRTIIHLSPRYRNSFNFHLYRFYAESVASISGSHSCGGQWTAPQWNHDEVPGGSSGAWTNDGAR
jgi:hypothetical protein